jgi:hypothetical protein
MIQLRLTALACLLLVATAFTLSGLGARMTRRTLQRSLGSMSSSTETAQVGAADLDWPNLG